jgi:hypothetical protein
MTSVPEPRIVQSTVTVEWDGNPLRVRPGSIVTIVPGSALEAAYGGAGNLEPLSDTTLAGDGASADKSWLNN